MRIMQLAREGSPPPRLRLPQAELSRKSNQIARGRIRGFESDMPSQAVGLQQPNAARSMASRVEDVPRDFGTHRRFNNLRSYVARGAKRKCCKRSQFDAPDLMYGPAVRCKRFRRLG